MTVTVTRTWSDFKCPRNLELYSGSADAHFHFSKYPLKMHDSGRTVEFSFCGSKLVGMERANFINDLGALVPQFAAVWFGLLTIHSRGDHCYWLILFYAILYLYLFILHDFWLNNVAWIIILIIGIYVHTNYFVCSLLIPLFRA